MTLPPHRIKRRLVSHPEPAHVAEISAPPHATQRGAHNDPESSPPGQYRGTVFRYGRGLANPALPGRTSAQQPRNAKARRGGPGDPASSWLELLEDEQSAGAGSVTGLGHSSPDDGGGHSSGDSSKEKERQHARSLARHFSSARRAGAGARRSQPSLPLRLIDLAGSLRTSGNRGSRSEFAAAAIAAIDRMEARNQGAAAIRRALMHDLKDHVEVWRTGAAEPGSLADVRARLIEATRTLERTARSSSEAAGSLRCLLVLVMLNMKRPRTVSQAGLTHAKLGLLSQA